MISTLAKPGSFLRGSTDTGPGAVKRVDFVTENYSLDRWQAAHPGMGICTRQGLPKFILPICVVHAQPSVVDTRPW